MGRGFWSRGPANSAQGKKAEYPTLFAACQLDHVEYASATQAHLDLIQLMSNSKLAVVGSWICVLYDFQQFKMSSTRRQKKSRWK
jgi:hypothetical protein